MITLVFELFRLFLVIDALCVALQWLSPSEYQRNVISISPQNYEMNRLSRFSQLNELSEFAERRQKLGLLRQMSVILRCRDAALLILPGNFHRKYYSYFIPDRVRVTFSI